MKTNLSASEMASILNMTAEGVRNRIQKLGLEHFETEQKTRLYTFSDFEKIKNFEKRNIRMYDTFVTRIETTYHIYQSKINYLDIDISELN